MKYFSMAFVKDTPPGGDGGGTGGGTGTTSVWGTYNPVPGGEFPPGVEKEDLSIYLTSHLLGPDPIELKCMSNPEDSGGNPYWTSDMIPWKGDQEVLDYCGLGELSTAEQENLTVRYGIDSIKIVTGGEEISADKMANYGETPGGYIEIDSTTQTYENVWAIHATYFNNNSDGQLHLVLGYIEMVPEGDPRPGNRVLFGTYKLIQYYWEGWDPVDFDNPSGDWQPGGGYYPGMTETTTSYVISPSPNTN